ncbi:MAG: hypothetical protein QNK05_01415 [Myxococcota bacterium]|nr:hypothetical protein [Myxococcota bacterium]
MSDPWKEVPAAVRAVLERLVAEGYEAALVGGCVRTLVARGDAPPGRPDSPDSPRLPASPESPESPDPLDPLDWDVTTDAPPERVLELFRRAVPIGLQHGTVMVPTAGGPVDVTTWRAESLEGDLARRDFRVNAMALPFPSPSSSPSSADAPPWLLDPHGGRADLEAGRLRAVGDPDERLSEDPLRALRAIRFQACLGLTPDASLADALRRVSLASVAAERKRAELARLLLGPNVEAALVLLAESSLGAQLAPEARPDAPAVVARVPARLDVRLSAWLRGTREQSVLASLRFGHAVGQRVASLLALHPIDESAAPSGPALRRVLRRVGEQGLDDLIALRRAELDAGIAGGAERARLNAIDVARGQLARQGKAALVRADLAIQGPEVMKALDCRPGPIVGRALAYLTECVLDDPECNTPEALLERLARWEDPGPRARAPRSRGAGTEDG